MTSIYTLEEDQQTALEDAEAGVLTVTDENENAVEWLLHNGLVTLNGRHLNVTRNGRRVVAGAPTYR